MFNEYSWFFVCSNTGNWTIEKKVPDTITSWMISAFSLSSVRGLSIMEESVPLKVFQPFFVSVNLPFSVIHSEIVSMPLVIHNYLSEPQFVTVEIDSPEGEIELKGEAAKSTESNKGTRVTFRTTVMPETPKGFDVNIRFNKVGSTSIKVTGISSVAGDSLIKVVEVRPEGVPQYRNNPILIDLSKKKSFETDVIIDVPDDAVPDSTIIEVNVFGDLFGSTLSNLQNLIRLPSGCGEQNMLNFVPNILVMNYLQATDQFNQETAKKIKSFTEIGYQGELSYRHYDGSFSVFGKSDRTGSTWLTAIVAKAFRQATALIEVDENIVKSALEWLKQIQQADGSFKEIGHISHRPMQGGSGKGIALTAFVTIAFLENKEAYPEYKTVIDNAIWHIVKNYQDNENNIYLLAVATYVMQLAKHEVKDTMLDILLQKSKTHS